MRIVFISCAALFGTLFVVLTVVGLIGNSVVIAAISCDKKMRHSVMNMLLFNLAIADALNLIITTVEWSPTIALGRLEWILPAILCPLARYLEIIFLFVSILTQIVVCVERYVAIVYPMHARRLCSRQNIFILIVLTWLFVVLFAIPYALLHRLTPKCMLLLCRYFKQSLCVNPYVSTSFWRRYKWLEFFCFYFIPCIFQQYVSIFAKLVKLTKKQCNLCITVSTSEAVVHHQTEALRIRRNVVKMLVGCVSMYFICYSPIQTIFLSKALFDVQVSTTYEFILLMDALALMCSACNPLLYALFSKKFRARIARILVLSCSYICCYNRNRKAVSTSR
ncbi:unnamed protein product [Thelazia callipaeda]|uniref:G_PROTEIN_RECEP_F1_2 domain-containing protein n=1 Tax=Thelazia callipaeda TaxID=103827 RepID=A0A0N5CVD8_THECL|nr:unnamed protein product [Thelazia callipaeda]